MQKRWTSEQLRRHGLTKLGTWLYRLRLLSFGPAQYAGLGPIRFLGVPEDLIERFASRRLGYLLVLVSGLLLGAALAC